MSPPIVPDELWRIVEPLLPVEPPTHDPALRQNHAQSASVTGTAPRQYAWPEAPSPR